ncbi:MAG: S8 family serine peptidase [Oligoflexia bacterium]|nr:S8 family serine peptidase [Oligoflexia bacterium]
MKIQSLPSTLVVAVLAAMAGTFAFGTRALGGEWLRLKSGDVQLVDGSSQLLMNALSATEQSDAGRYFVIQFDGTIPAGTDLRLASGGLEVLRYIPDDAYVVRGTYQSASLARDLAGVRAVSSFLPEWKISEEFSGSRGVFAARGERLFVTVMDAFAVRDVALRLRALPGVRVRHAGTVDLIVDATPAALPSIAAVEGVEWVQKLPIFVTFDYAMDSEVVALDLRASDDYEYTGYESGTRIMNFETSWDRGFRGDGQFVAVGDTGLDNGDIATIHPDFAGAVHKGYAIGLGSESWEDPMGHGTHVAGSVAGRSVVSSGKLRGGAYGSKLLIEGLWSAILDNLVPGTDFNKLFGVPFADGARIHTNSWGSATNFGAYDSFASKVDDYMWNNPDLLVLFAAGNSGEDKNKDGRVDENSIASPGTAKNVLTVGASENLLLLGGIQKPLGQLRGGDAKWGVAPLKDDLLSNNPNGVAAFSSRGPTADGRLKPEIVAPGTNIVSVKSRHPKAQKLWGDFLGGTDYVYSGGTSMSTPLTAGAAAVTREYLVKEFKIATPSAAVIKAALMHTAVDMFPGQYGEGAGQELPTRRPNVHEGYGRVDMAQVTGLGKETEIVDNRAGVATGEEFSIKVKVLRGALRATLSYTDAPATPSAKKTLVNDLDLKVIAPDGLVKELGDHINNSEMIEQSGLAAGDYTVVVRGANVPRGKSGKQPFALLVTSF